MKILKNDYLVKADKHANETKEVYGVTIHIDTSWDTVAHAVKYGEKIIIQRFAKVLKKLKS